MLYGAGAHTLVRSALSIILMLRRPSSSTWGGPVPVQNQRIYAGPLPFRVDPGRLQQFSLFNYAPKAGRLGPVLPVMESYSDYSEILVYFNIKVRTHPHATQRCRVLCPASPFSSCTVLVFLCFCLVSPPRNSHCVALDR